MNLHEERLSGKHIFKGRVIDLEVDQIRLPDGHDSIREVINHPGGVAIAALNERDELLMVRQFRYPFHSVLLELPAGKLEPGEIPLEAAKREQKEETGTQAEEYIFLGKCYATPAYCTEQIIDLIANGVNHIHVYSMNKPEIAAGIQASLSEILG